MDAPVWVAAPMMRHHSDDVYMMSQPIADIVSPEIAQVQLSRHGFHSAKVWVGKCQHNHNLL